MKYILLVLIELAAICGALGNGQTVVKTVPTASQWLIYRYWTNSACTEYAGEYTIGTGECYPNTQGSVYYSQYYNGVEYTLTTTYYSDTECKSQTSYYYDYYYVQCTNSGNGYYYTSTVVDTPPTTFPSNGLLTSIYDSASNCTNNVGLMAYLYQVYNSNICYPWLDNKYSTVTSCTYSTYGYSNAACSTYTNTATSYDCQSTPSFATLGTLLGYPVATCVDGTVNSISPTVSPTNVVVPTNKGTWLKYTYWSDAACTQYAGEQAGKVNTCVKLHNGNYANSTYYLYGSQYVLNTIIYSDSGCTIASGSATDYYSYFCTYDSGHFYTASIVNDVSSTFKASGTLTSLYASYEDCTTVGAGIIWYVYEVQSTGYCYSYLNGTSTSMLGCAEFYSCMTGAISTPTVDTCEPYPSYVTNSGLVGYPYYQCFSGTESVAPTIQPTAEIIPTNEGAWLQYTYWSDSACTQYAGEQGGIGKVCVRTNTGYYTNSTITTFGTEYIINIAQYNDPQCTEYVGASTMIYNIECNFDFDHYYTTQIINDIPSSFAEHGALTILYDDYGDCFQEGNAVWYIYEVFNTNICYEYLDGYYVNTNSCGAYYECNTDIAFSVVMNQCDYNPYYASSTYALGYPYTTCFGTGTDSNDDNSGGGDIPLNAGTMAAIIVPCAVVVLAGAAFAYYYFFVMSASTLTAPLIAGGGGGGAAAVSNVASNA